MNNSNASIILASQSPRRKQILAWADIHFEVVVSNADESFDSNLLPHQVPIFIATQKANAVRNIVANNNATIIAADTVVVLGNAIINKPADKEEAVRMLQQLSGKMHQVITGVVVSKGATCKTFFDVTEVFFNEITNEQINYYIDNYKPYDKAGAYAIQEWIGVVAVNKINGDFYNVMGLPISKVLIALKEINTSTTS